MIECYLDNSNKKTVPFTIKKRFNLRIILSKVGQKAKENCQIILLRSLI